MPITLPTSLPNASRSRGIGRLPSSADVPSVRPPSDPGLRVPVISSGAGLASLGAELSDLALMEQQQAAKEATRNGAVDAADKTINYNQAASDQLRTLSTTDDLSNPNTLKAFGKFLEEQKQALLSAHKGTPDTLARLRVQLDSIKSRITGQAASMAADIGRKKIGAAANQALVPLDQRVADDPAMLSDSILRFGNMIDLMSPGLTPDEQFNLRMSGQSRLTETAIGSFLAAGNIDAADNTLRVAEAQGLLDPNTAARTRQKLADVREAKNASLIRLEEFRTLTGREPTPAERQSIALASLGIKTGPEPLVAIADATSPSGLRFVPQSQAVGRPAPSKTPLVQVGSEKFGQVPPGFQLKIDPLTGAATMEAIPGSPAAAKEQSEAAKEKNLETIRGGKSDVILESVNRALGLLDRAGGALRQAGAKFIPGTAAFTLDQQLVPLRSIVALDSLQQIRDASPTGGGLGRVTNVEVGLLQSSLGNLELPQEPSILRKTLLNIRERFANARFGTDEERAQAVKAGRITQEQADDLARQRAAALAGKQPTQPTQANPRVIDFNALPK